MNRLVTGIITACGAVALSLPLSIAAFAQTHSYSRTGLAYFQDRDHDGDRDRDRDRDRDQGAWDRERLEREYRGAFYDRLQSDLDRAEHAGYLRGDEFNRIQRAHREVAHFQEKWSRGVFDAHEMDDAIASVQRVMDMSALRREDRDALREDLFAMRRFRAHMEGRR